MTNHSSNIGDYLEPGYTPHPAHLSDEIYGQVLDSIVITCVDIILTHQGKILLGKRAWHPQADWWLIGGRMKPGETLEGTAARNAQRELALTLEPSRFSYLTAFSTAWRQRRHAPVENGTHTTSFVMTIALTDEEAAGIKLNEEYTAQQWLYPDAVLASEAFHPALHQCAQALIAVKTL